MTQIAEEIIDAVDKDIIEKELTADKLLRHTKSGSNELYIVDYHNSPNIMREIGRLRELSFRNAGGGTGKSIDIDQSDIVSEGYKQLIVWNPAEKDILGGYRYIVSKSTDTKYLSTEHYFKFSDKFRAEYLPYMIELGRSFVQPKYQGHNGNPKGIFALDNLWEGIGAIAAQNKHIKYFFGKVTMYIEYNADARNELIYFLRTYFADTENLTTPLFPKEITYDNDKMANIYNAGSYSEDYKILVKRVREYGEVVPPLINAYMKLSPSLKVFDTVCNPDFGNVEETGILVTINDLYSEKYNRYISNK
ncbi:MAG: GNAT family N-acetyltransferase [Rikenellaceae bacterium]